MNEVESISVNCADHIRRLCYASAHIHVGGSLDSMVNSDIYIMTCAKADESTYAMDRISGEYLYVGTNGW